MDDTKPDGLPLTPELIDTLSKIAERNNLIGYACYFDPTTDGVWTMWSQPPGFVVKQADAVSPTGIDENALAAICCWDEVQLQRDALQLIADDLRKTAQKLEQLAIDVQERIDDGQDGRASKPD